MIDLPSLVLGLLTAGLATGWGYAGRRRWHQRNPLHDPWFLLTLAGLIGFAALLGYESASGRTLLSADAADRLLMMTLALTVFYVMGFAMAHPDDTVWVSAAADGRVSVLPLVHYIRDTTVTDADGVRRVVPAEYLMPQSLGGALRSWAGARDELDFPRDKVRVTATREQTNGFIHLHTDGVISVCRYDRAGLRYGKVKLWSRKVKDADGTVVSREPVYLCHIRAVRHILDPSQTSEQDYDTYLTETEVWRRAVLAANAEHERATRLAVQYEADRFEAAGDLVDGLIDLTEDAPGAADDLRQRLEAERRQRTAGQHRDGDASVREAADVPPA